MKEARSKRIHTMWLHLREAQKWVKEIHIMTSQDNSYYIVITFGEMGDLYVCVCVYVSDSATLWTVAHQAPLSMGFSRQEYWSRLLCPPPGDLPNPGMKPVLLCLLHWQVGSLPLMPPGKPKHIYIYIYIYIYNIMEYIWTIIQPQKRMKSGYLWQHGWTTSKAYAKWCKSEKDKYHMISLLCGTWKTKNTKLINTDWQFRGWRKKW